MHPSYQIPGRFSDFEPAYISSLATSRNYTYTAVGQPDASESSLYNNPETATQELYRIQLTIDGLECEYYAADFTPVVIARMMKSGQLPAVAAEAHSNRIQAQVFSIALPYSVENLYVESRTNVTFNNIVGLSSVSFRGTKNARLEGDFNHFFRVYVPTQTELNAFTILAPNIMLCLLADGGDYDFEFSGNKIYFYKTFGAYTLGTIPLNKASYDHMLQFGIDSAKILARASRPARQLDPQSSVQMWQLFDVSSGKAMTIISIGIVTLSIAFIIPLLWPFLGLAILLFYVHYKRLLKKRKRLVQNWHRDDV